MLCPIHDRFAEFFIVQSVFLSGVVVEKKSGQYQVFRIHFKAHLCGGDKTPLKEIVDSTCSG
jgi:hypothetical protein